MARKARRRRSPISPPRTFHKGGRSTLGSEMTEVTELSRPAGEALDTKEVLLNLGPQHP
ncbi:NADH-quinone oxidoreductase subunit D, partial [Mesorhizobium sp. M5C.F.Ca.IN.020.14.1.1]